MSEDSGLYGVGNGDGPYGLTTFRFLPDGTVQMDRADWNEVIQKAMRQKKEIEDLQTNVLVADPGRWTKKQCELITVATGAKADGFVAVLDHVQNLRTEVQQFRSHLYHANDSLQETASALAATSKEQVRLVRERDAAVQELTQCKRTLEQSRAQEEIARAKEATIRAAYLPVLAQAKIAADFQETLEKIAVLFHLDSSLPLTEIPTFFATEIGSTLPLEWLRDVVEQYVTQRNDAQRKSPGISEGESYT